MAQKESKNTGTLSNVISIIFLLGFITIALSLVFSKGVCCGDDAYLSVVAKNLANGLGYTSTIQPYISRFALQPYDPLVGTGPTVILPASLFINFFGNTYWAPGLANVTLWSFLLVCVGLFLQKYNNGINKILFTFSFLYLAYFLMALHFEHWYALLGEVPAALLVLLGVLCFLYRDRRVNQILSGILFSLAVQAKLLTLFAFLIFLVTSTLLIYSRNRSNSLFILWRNVAYRIFYIIIGFLIPFVMFELWKFFVMGPSAFIENWQQFLRYAGNDGAKINQSSSLIELYDARSKILVERFGILTSNIGLILMLAWLMVRKDENLRNLFITVSSIVSLYFFWWFFLSIGRPRYFIICLILLIFLITLPLLSKRKKSVIFVYFVLTILFSSNNWIRVNYPFMDLKGRYFVPTSHTQDLLLTSKMLSQEVETNETRIATQWWATAADIEYIMDPSLNFTTFRDDALMNRGSFWVAVNMQFVVKEDKEFAHLLDSCTYIQKRSIYIIALCEPSSPK